MNVIQLDGIYLYNSRVQSEAEALVEEGPTDVRCRAFFRIDWCPVEGYFGGIET